MENIKVCTHGTNVTIGEALKMSPSMVQYCETRNSSPKHILVKTLKHDLVRAQEKVLRNYQQKGLI